MQQVSDARRPAFDMISGNMDPAVKAVYEEINRRICTASAPDEAAESASVHVDMPSIIDTSGLSVASTKGII